MQTSQYALIEGEFNAEEAGKILFALFNSKINYHSLESMRMKEQHNGSAEHAERRMNELMKSYNDIRMLLEKAEKDGVKLKIHGTVVIERA